MKRRVKEFVDIADHVSLDDLIEKLAEVRAGLPQDSEAEMRLRGDEVFGHRRPVGFGPSSKTCPRWPPQRAHSTSVRSNTRLRSVRVTTARGSGFQKLGQ